MEKGTSRRVKCAFLALHWQKHNRCINKHMYVCIYVWYVACVYMIELLRCLHFTAYQTEIFNSSVWQTMNRVLTRALEPLEHTQAQTYTLTHTALK